MVTHYSNAMSALLAAAETSGFALTRCRGCDHTFYPPQSFCPSCLSPEVGHTPDPGEATVLSICTIHRSLDPAWDARLPMHVACVKTASGQSLFAIADEKFPAGTKVRLRRQGDRFHVFGAP